jgi:hypothetical protein
LFADDGRQQTLTKIGSPQELVNPGVFVGVLQNMGLEEGGLCTRTGD